MPETKTIYNTIVETPKSTVVAEYIPTKKGSDKYQSEDDLEKEFIRILQANGYEYLTIKSHDDLVLNLRNQLSRLNDITFSDDEWNQIFDKYLANPNEGIVEKTTKIQDDDDVYYLYRDGKDNKNIRIIDKTNIHNNTVQVINQYATDSGNYKNRYDVTILVNGLPLVHVELKRRGVAIREAFNQINRYQRDSFWSDSGLFEYIQLFVISNGTNSKYYSNTTRHSHIQEAKGNRKGKKTSKNKKTSNSFEFTCWWTDAKNTRIADLVDFAKTFFSKHSLLAILIKYCVFTDDKLLLAMRPYQIVAAERILNKITMATNHKKLGTIDAGGYVWHTTGSGKTLTSFKVAQLASSQDNIDKVIFVVDRKDLDYQTMKEYEKFCEGSANSNANTKILSSQLADKNAKIIITTIQKLARFISTKETHSVFNEHIVLIFDECHRSQFGDMHRGITKAFKNYHIFGFTGTPIFAANAASGGNPKLKTTEQAFGKKLHSYTIVNAINDNNVLPFRIEYINTLKIKENIKDKKVRAIDVNAAASAPERIRQVTEYIIQHFDQKTKRNDRSYSFSRLANIEDVAKNKKHSTREQTKEIRNQVHLKGFNSIFAVSSIEVAKKYYAEFKSQNSRLKTAIIYSFGANEEENEDGTLADEGFETKDLDKPSRDFLEGAIADYNKHFGTNYDTSSDKFENYYKNLSQRMKNREIDLLIVVNMFLTGFDATTLNTLWVDKNLRHHGLLQAFSRTNRILNSVKAYGDIICFRDLEDDINDALSIFGDKEASSVVLLRPYNDYYNGWDEDGKHHKGYVEMIAELQTLFPLPLNIKGEQAEKDFIKLWGAILRRINILSSFDQFRGNKILTEQDEQDYKGAYLDLYDKLRKHKDADKENINDDIEFEIELVKQITINVDYILQLVVKYHQSGAEDKTEIRTKIDKAVNASIELRSKKELIKGFIDSLNIHSDIGKHWQEFTNKSKKEDLEKIIKEEDLESEKTRKFMDNAFRDGELKDTGTSFPSIIKPISRFSKNNERANKKNRVFEKLSLFFEKYLGT